MTYKDISYYLFKYSYFNNILDFIYQIKFSSKNQLLEFIIHHKFSIRNK